MKIALWHYHTLRLRRGIETLVLSLANALVDQGVDVSLVTARSQTRPLVPIDPRVKVYAYPATRYAAYAAIVPFYAAHFLRHTYDDVAAFFADFGEGPTLRAIGRHRSIPLTLYLCYPASAVPHRYQSFLRWKWDATARRIVGDARWIAEEAATLFKRPVGVLPVGTDSARFSPDPTGRNEWRRSLGYADDDVVLLNVSALERRKGTWRVLEAMDRLRNRQSNLRYYILGEGAYETDLRGMVDDLGLNGVVQFGGTTNRLERFYRMTDIFAMLPDSEANSIACHEAMSCGLPVIASNSGGFPEDLPSDAGILVDPDDPEAVDDAICRLASDASLRASMGAIGRRAAVENYSWDRLARLYVEGIV